MNKISWRWKSISITAISLGGSALGLLSQIEIAQSFGATAAVDALFFALAAPMFLAGILASSISLYAPTIFREALTLGGMANHENQSISYQPFRVVLGLTLCIVVVAFIQQSSLPNESHISVYPAFTRMLACGWGFAILWVLLSVLTSASIAQGDVINAALAQAGPAVGGVVVLFSLGAALGPLAFMLGQIIGGLLAIWVLFSKAAPALAVGSRHFMRRLTGGGEALVLSAFAMLSFSSYPLIDSWLAPRMGEGVMSSIAFAQRLIIGLGTTLIAAPFSILVANFADIALTGNESQHTQLLRNTLLRYVPLLIFLSLGLCLYADRVVLIFQLDERTRAEVARATQYMSPGMSMMLVVAILYRATSPLTGGQIALAKVGVIWMFSYAMIALILKGRGLMGLASAYSMAWGISFAAAMLLMKKCVSNHFLGRGRNG